MSNIDETDEPNPARIEEIKKICTEIAQTMSPIFDDVAKQFDNACKLDFIVRTDEGTFIITGGRETMDLPDLIADLAEYDAAVKEAHAIVDETEVSGPTEH